MLLASVSIGLSVLNTVYFLKLATGSNRCLLGQARALLEADQTDCKTCSLNSGNPALTQMVVPTYLLKLIFIFQFISNKEEETHYMFPEMVNIVFYL